MRVDARNFFIGAETFSRRKEATRPSAPQPKRLLMQATNGRWFLDCDVMHKSLVRIRGVHRIRPVSAVGEDQAVAIT